jgi:uncharacterized membrane protein (UPF0136 family)
MNPRTGLLVLVATPLGIACGLGSAWVIYSQRLPHGSNYWGLAPSAISILVYAAIVGPRLHESEMPMPKLGLVAVGGLLVLIAIESIPIIMIGCRYGACINL